MNTTGMNTATSDRVMDRMVKETSAEPFSAAWRGVSPISMCRTMFSSITMASSTTKPTDRVMAISDRLSRLRPSIDMPAKVPTMESGSASAGMMVADTLRRKRKITPTTSAAAIRSVSSTLSIETLMLWLRS